MADEIIITSEELEKRLLSNDVVPNTTYKVIKDDVTIIVIIKEDGTREIRFEG